MEVESFLPLGGGCQLLAFGVSTLVRNVPGLSSLEMLPTLAISEEIAVGRIWHSGGNAEGNPLNSEFSWSAA
jgi:hypothetical protein